MKFYMLDNYDSFVYNLAAYFQEEGQDVIVETPDIADFSKIERESCKGIIISPGPGAPEKAVFSRELLKEYEGKIPILGVCLGHQVIGHYYGAEVRKGTCPMHGKNSVIQHNGSGIFTGLPKSFQVTRYHSLIIKQGTLPKELHVDAVTADGVIMGISHRAKPIYGLQFHPEALLTEFGHAMIQNYINLCEKWEQNNGRN